MLSSWAKATGDEYPVDRTGKKFEQCDAIVGQLFGDPDRRTVNGSSNNNAQVRIEGDNAKCWLHSSAGNSSPSVQVLSTDTLYCTGSAHEQEVWCSMWVSQSLIHDPGLVHMCMCVPPVERTPGTLPGYHSKYRLLPAYFVHRVLMILFGRIKCAYLLWHSTICRLPPGWNTWSGFYFYLFILFWRNAGAATMEGHTYSVCRIP